MSLHHFFLDEQILACESKPEFILRLDADDLKHARVLRLRAGEHIAVVDADSDYFECEIVSFGAVGGAGSTSITAGLGDSDASAKKALGACSEKYEMRVRISGHPAFELSSAQVFLAQGLAKGSKFEDVVRHATEIGVAGFIPLKCARSVMRLDGRQTEKKLTRWRAIAKSAAMQSGQLRVPNICSPMNVLEFAGSASDFDCVCVCWEEAQQTCCFADALSGVKGSIQKNDTLKSTVQERDAVNATRQDGDTSQSAKKVAVVVGPEGGLTTDEVEAILASNENAHLVSLGRSILRTETAGVLAPALAMYELGELGGKL